METSRDWVFEIVLIFNVWLRRRDDVEAPSNLFEHSGQDGGAEDGEHGDLDVLRSVTAITFAGADVGVVLFQDGLVAVPHIILTVLVFFISTATNDPFIATNWKKKMQNWNRIILLWKRRSWCQFGNMQFSNHSCWPIKHQNLDFEDSHFNFMNFLCIVKVFHFAIFLFQFDDWNDWNSFLKSRKTFGGLKNCEMEDF